MELVQGKKGKGKGKAVVGMVGQEEEEWDT